MTGSYSSSPRDMDHDGDIDFVSTRGNSYPYDGVFWLEQIRTRKPVPRFIPARASESKEMGLPEQSQLIPYNTNK